MRLGASSWTALAAALVLVATAAHGTLTAVQTVTATPATKVPVTLASTQGTILSPFTSASLPGISLPALNGLVTVLTIEHGTASWSLQATVTAKSGFTPITDSVTLSLVGPTTSTVTLTQGSAVPASTGSVTLGTSSDVLLRANGLCVGTCSITLELRFTSASAAIPSFVLPVTLSVT